MLMACGMASPDCTVTMPVQAPRERPAPFTVMWSEADPVPESGLTVSQLAPGTTDAVHCGEAPPNVSATSVAALRDASATASVTVPGATAIATGEVEAAARVTLTVAVTLVPISLTPLMVEVR